MELVGLAEIREMFGISRQRAYQLTQKNDFPTPAAELRMGNVWRKQDVVAWARRTDREIVNDLT